MLIADNAMTYNRPDTVFHQEAIKLKQLMEQVRSRTFVREGNPLLPVYEPPMRLESGEASAVQGESAKMEVEDESATPVMVLAPCKPNPDAPEVNPVVERSVTAEGTGAMPVAIVDDEEMMKGSLELDGANGDIEAIFGSNSGDEGKGPNSSNAKKRKRDVR